MIDLFKPTEANRAVPEDVAEAFAAMDSEQQRQFFNHLALVVARRPGDGFVDWLAGIVARRSGASALRPDARRLMFLIGHYADGDLENT